MICPFMPSYPSGRFGHLARPPKWPESKLCWGHWIWRASTEQVKTSLPIKATIFSIWPISYNLSHHSTNIVQLPNDQTIKVNQNTSKYHVQHLYNYQPPNHHRNLSTTARPCCSKRWAPGDPYRPLCRERRQRRGQRTLPGERHNEGRHLSTCAKRGKVAGPR